MAAYMNTYKISEIMVELPIPNLTAERRLNWVGISLVNFSRNTNNGLNCSTFYLNANNVTSNSNVNIDSGVLLNIIGYINRTYSLLVGRTNSKTSLSVGSINVKALGEQDSEMNRKSIQQNI